MVQEFESVLSSCDFSFISDINFSWFPTECHAWWLNNMKCNPQSRDVIPYATGNRVINIHFSKRNPAGMKLYIFVILLSYYDLIFILFWSLLCLIL
jgi:hypothetical protein